jgi:hypothetical protein
MWQAQRRWLHSCQRVDGDVTFQQLHLPQSRNVILRLPGFDAAEEAKIRKSKLGGQMACSEKAVDVALHTDRDPHERISEDSAYERNPQLNDGCLITKLRPQIFDNNEDNTL